MTAPDPGRARLVRRCLQRYEMLMTAHQAETATRIGQGGRTQASPDEDALQRAASISLARISESTAAYDTTKRVEGLIHAASIALVTDHMGDTRRKWYDEKSIRDLLSEVPQPDLSWAPGGNASPTATNLLEFALNLLGHFSHDGQAIERRVDYLELRVVVLLAWIRAGRLESDPGGRWSESLRHRHDELVIPASGLEHYRWRFEYERIAALCAAGSVEEIDAYLEQSDPSSRKELGRIAEDWSRGKVLFGRSVAQYLSGATSPAELLEALTHEIPDALYAGKNDSVGYLIHQLNAKLCAMDVASSAAGEAGAGAVMRLAQEAMADIELIMKRWRILARSSSSLTSMLLACLGDIAVVCAAHPALGSETGFRLATMVKQSSLMHLLRDPAVELPKVVRRQLVRINEQEQLLWDPNIESEAREAVRADYEAALERAMATHADIAKLEKKVLSALGPLMIDMNGLTDGAPDDVRSRLGGAEALDFVWIATSANPSAKRWFRTHISATGGFTFTGPHRPFPRKRAQGQASLAWLRSLSQLLLPPGLVAAEETTLLISPHQAHDEVPWPALLVGDAHLAERCSVALVPSLPNLARESVGPASGPGLAQLVEQGMKNGRPHGQRLRLDAELASWGYAPLPGEHVHTLRDATGRNSQRLDSGDIATLLRRHSESTGFLHIAAHCSGKGIRQTINLPHDLTVSQAFGLPWPPSVLLATCYSGQLGEDSEPLALSVAVLLGGATAVVAGIGEIADSVAGFLSSRIVAAVREGTELSLPDLLRAAQRAAIAEQLDPGEWGRLVAYVRGNGAEVGDTEMPHGARESVGESTSC
ncbi:hypothetical protein [Gordonia alkaliphila]|uniref:CHAT domain-containing protein n=1 Tax=Gordonia alkaliphila TaxID=1053547 RepID=A0ABP8ZKT4_9ACTN